MSVAAEAPTLRKIPVEPGIYRGVPFEEYFSWDAVNASMLKKFSKTPAHVRHWLDRGGDDDATPSLDLGWLFHLAILERERFDDQVVVAPVVNKRTNIGKAQLAEFEARHAGKYVAEEKTFGQVRAMARALLSHEKAAPYFAEGGSEISVVWDDKATGIRCKARVDHVAPLDGWPIVGDLKSAEDASPWAWERAVARYGYHISAVHYLEGLEALVPIPAGVPFRRFVHFVVESDPPHCVALYELDDAAREEGAIKRRRYLRQWKECTSTGRWPGYPTEIQVSTLPRWAFTDYHED